MPPIALTSILELDPCIIDVLSLMHDEVDDDYMTSILSSSCSQHTSDFESVVDDESFALAACRQKGQPKMTDKMFADWVKADYSLVVHGEPVYASLIMQYISAFCAHPLVTSFDLRVLQKRWKMAT